jgi:hypothetical protein
MISAIVIFRWTIGLLLICIGLFGFAGDAAFEEEERGEDNQTP